jgi:hypothetical protein
MKWGFANFWGEKCKKLSFCNVEMTKTGYDIANIALLHIA